MAAPRITQGTKLGEKKKETENVSHYFTIKILISPKGFCYKIQVGKAEKLFVMQTMQKVGQ